MATRIKPCFSSNLTLLSWNIALTEPSAICNRNSRECTHLICEECLSHNPDVIALQESPYPSWGADTFGDYISMGTRQSHCGYVDLLLHNKLTNYKHIELDKQLPSVAASVTLRNKSNVALSSSHFAPFKENFPLRVQQCNRLMSSVTQECGNCILIGDFNMRTAEDVHMENLCGGWADAWKSCGSNTVSKFTWNSFANRFHEGGFKFKARFDRCYTKGDELNTNQFSMIGVTPIRSGDYLSDHFGILVKMSIGETVTDLV